MLELAPKIKSVHDEKIAVISEVSEIHTQKTVKSEDLREHPTFTNIHYITLYPCFVFVNDCIILSQSDFTIALFFNTSNRSCLLQIVKIGNL